MANSDWVENDWTESDWTESDWTESDWAASPDAPKPATGLLDKLGQRVSNVIAPMPTGTPMAEARIPVRVAGQAIGAVGDVAGAAIGALTPDVVKTKLAEGTDKLWDTLTPTERKLITGTVSKYKEYKEKYPDLFLDLESAANVASVVPIGKAAQVAASPLKEVGKMGKDAWRALNPPNKAVVDKTIRATIKNAADKAHITPKGVKSNMDIASFDKSMQDGVVEVVKAKNTLQYIDKEGNLIVGELPKTLDEFAQVIPQTKAPILKQYKEMTKAAGEEGISVSTKPAVDVLEAFQASPMMESMTRHYPESAKKITDLLGQYKKNPFMSPEAMEAEITMLNRMINKESDPFVDFVITGVNKANRKSLDGAIKSISGEGYQDLKNAWGALNEIEGRVAQRANIVNKGTRGIGYWDMASLAEGIAGLATLNPGIVVASVGTKTGAELLKKVKSPDNVIKNMFKNVDRQIASKGAFKPQSWVGKKLSKSSEQGSIDPKLAMLMGGGAVGGGLYLYDRLKNDQEPPILDAIKQRQVMLEGR